MLCADKITLPSKFIQFIHCNAVPSLTFVHCENAAGKRKAEKLKIFFDERIFFGQINVYKSGFQSTWGTGGENRFKIRRDSQNYLHHRFFSQKNFFCQVVQSAVEILCFYICWDFYLFTCPWQVFSPIRLWQFLCSHKMVLYGKIFGTMTFDWIWTT